MKSSEKSSQKSLQMDRINIMKKLMNEWRRYLQETASTEDRKIFPAKVYYGTSMDNLSTIRDKGIVNMPSDLEISQDKIGVPTCGNPHDAKKYGNVVIEIDGAYLRESGQYSCHPNSSGARVGMKDSASMSGSGSDPMVDRLGSKIPFDAVSGIIFSGTPNIQQLTNNGFGNLGIYSFGPDEEIKELYIPEEQEI